jgi:hypothetical protein
MPTGYTAPVEDGEVTELKDFAALCARAFMWTMRDTGMKAPLRYPEAPGKGYLQGSYEDALSARRLWQESTEEEKYAQWSTYYNDTLAEHARRRANILERNARHYAMLAQVQEVDVDAKLQNFKNFMIEQLTMSITNDGDHWYTILEYVEWCQMKDKETERSVKYYRDQITAEVERYNESCGWIDLLANTYRIEVVK